MKPADLKSPFPWENRFITIEDRIWYVPSNYSQFESFQFPGWLHPSLFAQPKPVKVEYCSGNGTWIASKAITEPQFNWVAVEKKFERVRRIWSKLKNNDLDNLLIVSGEAHTVTQNYFPSQSVSEAFINFPDPWPKTKHAKHRIVQLPFIQEIHRILLDQGVLTLVTDDIAYSEIMIETLGQHAGFESVFGAPYYVNEWMHYGSSSFEQRWREKGRAIRYHQFRKR